MTADYFDVLGAPMHLGRGFLSPVDELPGAPAKTVLTYALWRRRYASRPTIVGESITVNQRPFVVVGVGAAKPFGGDSANQQGRANGG